MDALKSGEARLATRISFFVAGFGLACWAPLVPLVRNHLNLDEGTLGLLLLCLGIGSVIAMTLTGALSARFGCKPIILVSGVSLAALLPALAVVGSPFQLGLILLGFGAALGSLDVAMNLHAVEVERAAQRPMMSGFHALFSVGGFAGASLMTLMLSMRVHAGVSTLIAALMMAAAMLIVRPRLVQTGAGEQGPLFALPRGVVLILALLAGIMFLVEGAILDWGALLVTDARLVDTAHGGLAYILFSIAMLSGRFSGDYITGRLGDRTVLLWGGVIAIGGMFLVLSTSITVAAMAGFILIGAGASNIVPVLFRLAGSQRAMPSGLAIAAISTVGYAGVLIGPAGIGFVAHHLGLAMSFALLAILMVFVPLSARAITKP